MVQESEEQSIAAEHKNSFMSRSEEKNTLSLALLIAFLLWILPILLGVSFTIGGSTVLGPSSFFLFPSVIGAICAVLAHNKYKNPLVGLLVGFLFSPMILYYLLCKRGVSAKKRELQEWKLEKEYQRMKKEKEDSL